MRADDQLVRAQWAAVRQARHSDEENLLAGIERTDLGALGPDQREAGGELVAELRDPEGHPGELEMIVRETLEALALGG